MGTEPLGEVRMTLTEPLGEVRMTLTEPLNVGAAL
jgi:hypothetical protein